MDELRNYYTTDQTGLALAVQESKKSNCCKRLVGAVIVTVSGELHTGYNHSLIPHTCTRLTSKSGTNLDKCPAIHAEVDAIVGAYLTNVFNATIYVSAPIPCKDCANAIVVSGISKVVCYLGHYDDLGGTILLENNVQIVQYKEL